MALESFTGVLTGPTSTDATFAVTGVGFVPKLVIFLPTHRTGTGANSADNVSVGVGAMDGTSEWYCGFGVTDASATSSVDYARHTGRCLIINTGSGTSSEEASFVSFDADGFTLNYSKAAAIFAYKTPFIAFAGSDCDFEVGTKTITSAAGTGTLATTTAFQPVGYLIAADNQSTADTLATGGDATFSFGGATAATEEFAVSIFDEDAQARTDTGRGISTTAVLQMQSAGTTVDVSAEHSSFNATDFTINVTNAPTSDTAVCWIAFGGTGLDCFVGNFTTSTAVATQAVTVETGFTPQSVIFAATDQTAVGASNDAILNLGLATGVSSTDDIQGYSIAEDDNLANSGPVTHPLNTNVLGEIAVATGAASSQYNIDSMDANGFTLGYANQAAALNIQTYFALKPVTSSYIPYPPSDYKMHGGIQNLGGI